MMVISFTALIASSPLISLCRTHAFVCRPEKIDSKFTLLAENTAGYTARPVPLLVGVER